MSNLDLSPSFISSKLDHCSSLLHGLPKYLLARVQVVQNAAARVVTLAPKFDQITLALINLHWLPFIGIQGPPWPCTFLYF